MFYLLRTDNITKKRACQDILATAICFLLFGWFLYAVHFGLNRVDEAFYLSTVQRFFLGDRLLVDEWHLSQLSALFLALPYKIFTGVTGSTDGIILFMRIVYVCTDMLLYWYIYLKLRRSGACALFCAGMISAFVPFAIFTLNYHTLPQMWLIPVLFSLTPKEGEQKKWKLTAAGFLFSLAVLMAPGFALLYFFYSFFVLLKQIKNRKGRALFPSAYDTLLATRTWRFFSIGVALAAILFIVMIAVSSGWGNVLVAVPELLSDSEYTANAVILFLAEKLKVAFRLFGAAPSAAAGILTLLSLLYRVRKTSFCWVRPSLFLLSACVAAGAMLHAFRARAATQFDGSWYYWFYFSCSLLPALFFGAVCRLLCRKKPENDYFLFWWAGLFSSLSMDLFSDVSLCICATSALIPCVFDFREAAREITVELTERTKKHGTANASAPDLNTKKHVAIRRCCAVIIGCMVVVFSGIAAAHAYFEGSNTLVETYFNLSDDKAISAEIEKGPYKGIRTTETHRRILSAMQNDLDTIKQESDAPFYIAENFPFAYLYTGKPIAAYSTWFNNTDMERQFRYWQLHPQKKPEWIYLPRYNSTFYCLNSEIFYFSGLEDTMLQTFDRICDFEQTEGEAGILLRITNWEDTFQ